MRERLVSTDVSVALARDLIADPAIQSLPNPTGSPILRRLVLQNRKHLVDGLGETRQEGNEEVSSPKVLVIEDAFPTRRLVELSLSYEGFEIMQREDGPSGLDAALTLIPDLIVLDIALPGMDGWEILRHIRADPTTEHIPVIVITAHDTAETRTKADHSHADGFVGKPFDLDQLRNEVNRLIGNRQSHNTPAR